MESLFFIQDFHLSLSHGNVSTNQLTHTWQNWILDSPITASLSREISFPKNQGNKQKVK
jgi:hypothetical protein